MGFALCSKLAQIIPAFVCSSCPSDRDFAYSFLQIPPHDGHPCCSANGSPLSGTIVVFHYLAITHAGHTSSRRNFAFYSQSSDLSHHNSGVPFGTGRLANALVFITSVFFRCLLDLNNLLCLFCNFRVPLYPPEFSVLHRLSAFIIDYLIYRLQNHINFQSFIIFLLLL